jgi:hypothetical protein
MTASLSNNVNPPFATGVDPYVNPPFLGYAMRAPTVLDVYNPGTGWLDNSVSPPVAYFTTGGGRWSTLFGTAGSFTSLTVVGATSLTGATTINTSGAAATTIGTGGTGTVSIGNATGNTAVTGNLTVTGNIIKAAAGNKDVYTSVASTTAAGANSAGTVTLVGGTATISTTSVTASSIIRIYRQGVGATGAAALGILSIGTKTAGVSFVINAVQAADATALQASDVSVIAWEIVN